MKKHIVIDCRFWGSRHTGLGRYTKSLIIALHRQRPSYHITLIVNPRYKKNIKKLTPRFNHVACHAPHYSFTEQLEIPQLIKTLNPHLTHFLHFNTPLLTPKPFMVTIHDLIKHHSKGMQTTTQWPFVYPVKRLGYYFSVYHAIYHSQRILTPSQWVKQDILAHFKTDSKKIIVSSEAADQIFFEPVKNQKPPLSGNYLIYVGNAYPHKHIIQLIKAIQKYNQKTQQDLKLLIISSRDIFYHRLRQQIRKLNALYIVKLKDFTTDKDLRYYYHHSSAFITASLYEGFGLPGLEAMASKTLVLAADRAAMPQVYQGHATYFDPENLDDMVKKIDSVVRLSALKRQQRIQKAYQYAAGFSWDKTAQVTLKAYEDCLSLR